MESGTDPDVPLALYTTRTGLLGVVSDGLQHKVGVSVERGLTAKQGWC